MYWSFTFDSPAEKKISGIRSQNGLFYGFMLNGIYGDSNFMTVENGFITVARNFEENDFLEVFQITDKSHVIDTESFDDTIRQSFAVYKTMEIHL